MTMTEPGIIEQAREDEVRDKRPLEVAMGTLGTSIEELERNADALHMRLQPLIAPVPVRDGSGEKGSAQTCSSHVSDLGGYNTRVVAVALRLANMLESLEV